MCWFFFFFNDTATTEIYTLSLHDALPILYTALPKFGIKPVLKPKGSFYLYADVSNITSNSANFCKRLLNKYGIVLTPGIDFDPYEGHKFVRFCYSYPKKSVVEGIKKLNTIFF